MAVYVDIQTVDRQASHRSKELLACYTIWREVMNLVKEYCTLLTWHKCHNSFCIPTEKILYMEKGLIDVRNTLVYCLWCSSVVLLSQLMFNICVQIWTISILVCSIRWQNVITRKEVEISFFCSKRVSEQKAYVDGNNIQRNQGKR